MEKTLNLPAELADRLSRREDQLGRILELGLRVVEREDTELDPDAGDQLPAAWQGAFAELVNQRRRASEEPPPSPEELIAYHHGELETGEEEKWLERLTLHPEAVRDLVDLNEFDPGGKRPGERHPGEAPGPRERPETAAALREFRARLNGRVPQSRRTFHSAPSWAMFRLAAAAMLAVALGASWIPWLLDRRANPPWGNLAEPRYAAVIDVAASRGARPFPVSEDAREILLILPLDVAAGAEQGTLRITASGGEVVYQDTFLVTDDRLSRLYLSLPRERLRPGIYRIEVTESAPNAQREAREYRFAITDPAPR